ncbi:MAG: hypothetical protein QOC71_1936, partial [Thermoplasmata archaeon]|nr:hypothetical protein [Thermoplasmata archaeon]
VLEVIVRLKDAGHLPDEFKSLAEAFHKWPLDREDPANKDALAMFAKVLDALDGSRLTSLIEFFRSTHAEMAAMLAAGEVGSSCRKSKLYCTTFPCHECARHIVHAGISEVVYIEPYAKSLGHKLHPDSICVTCSPRDLRRGFGKLQPSCSKVHFRPFTGIGPRMHARIFKADERRDRSTGQLRPWREGRPKLIGQVDEEHIIRAEAIALNALGMSFQAAQLTLDGFGESIKAGNLTTNGGDSNAGA